MPNQPIKLFFSFPLFVFVFCFACSSIAQNAAQQPRFIQRPAAEIQDKIRGGLLGQIFANLNGIKYENKHIKSPGNVSEYVPSLPDGGITDDDTDIEWVYILAMQKEGLFVPKEKLSGVWKASINKYIWCSNQYVRHLLDFGISTELTGMQEINPWAEFNIAGQFLSEMFALMSPCMPRYASQLGTYYTSISVDEEPLQTTQFFDTVIAEAFMTDNINELLDAGSAAVDPQSKVAEIIRNTRKWCAENPDNWRETRRLIHDTYTKNNDKKRDFNGYELNTAATVASLIYGKGDYVQTAIHTFNFGWDADNTAAAAGTIIGVIRGEKWFRSQGWEWKDIYRNTRRDNMPMDETITRYGDRLLELAEKHIVAAGGSVSETYYSIPVEQPRNVLSLSSRKQTKKYAFDRLKKTLPDLLEAESSGITPAGIAYLAVCLDIQQELEKKAPVKWKNAIEALNGQQEFLKNLYAERAIPSLEVCIKKLEAAGVQMLPGFAFLTCDVDTYQITKYNANGETIWVYDEVRPIDGWQLKDGTILMSYLPSAKTNNKGGVRLVKPDKSTVWDYQYNDEIMSCQPLPNGNVLINECGAGRISEINGEGKTLRSFQLRNKGMGHRTARFIRLTPQSTVLVGECYTGKLCEYDFDGKVLNEWTLPMVYCAYRLDNGNVLMSAYQPAMLREADKNGNTVWELSAKDLPTELNIDCFCEAVRLKNGNTLIGCGSRHTDTSRGARVAYLEVSPDKKVVWKMMEPSRKRETTAIKVL